LKNVRVFVHNVLMVGFREPINTCDISKVMMHLNLSARAYHRTQSVKLARTIADLAGCEEIQSVHLAEALHYRPKLILG
jgi:predicted ATPase with chaperone activity